MTWKRANVGDLYHCGSCKAPIGKDAIYAKTRHGAVRCEPCARQIEDPPSVIDNDEAFGVPPGVRHQASLGFGDAR